MSLPIFDAKLRISAEDDASQTIDSIKDRWSDYRQETLAVQHSTILNNQALYESAHVLTSVGHIAHTATSIYNSYTLGQLRLQNAEEAVTDAQQKLNEAIASGDPKKIEAAEKSLTKAKQAETQAINETRIAYILYGTEALGMAGRMIREYPKIVSLLKSITAATNEASLANAALSGGNVLPGMAGAGGVVGRSAGTLGAIASVAGPIGALVGGASAGLMLHGQDPNTQAQDDWLQKNVPWLNPLNWFGVKDPFRSDKPTTVNVYTGYSAAEVQGNNMATDQQFGNFMP